jgi:hypothetical protein
MSSVMVVGLSLVGEIPGVSRFEESSSVAYVIREICIVRAKP